MTSLGAGRPAIVFSWATPPVLSVGIIIPYLTPRAFEYGVQTPIMDLSPGANSSWLMANSPSSWGISTLSPDIFSLQLVVFESCPEPVNKPSPASPPTAPRCICPPSHRALRANRCRRPAYGFFEPGIFSARKRFTNILKTPFKIIAPRMNQLKRKK